MAPPNTRPYIAKLLEDSTSNIRLLELLPGHSDSPIECKIHVFPVTDCLNFVALSYTWGPEQPTCDIKLDGQSFFTRQNLWEALRAIRSPARNTTPGVTGEYENVEILLSDELAGEDENLESLQSFLATAKSKSRRVQRPLQLEPLETCRTCLKRAESKNKGLPVWPEFACLTCVKRAQAEKNKTTVSIPLLFDTLGWNSTARTRKLLSANSKAQASWRRPFKIQIEVQYPRSYTNLFRYMRGEQNRQKETLRMEALVKIRSASCQKPNPQDQSNELL